MPNWCSNRVYINGSTEDVAAFKALVRGSGDETTFSFHAILPCPQELLDVTEDAPSDYKDQLFLDYGYASWYDWRVANWGTKWDVSYVSSDFDDDNSAQWEFDTAWSPPQGIYDYLADRFPELSISWFYDEPGMQFAGYLNNPTNR